MNVAARPIQDAEPARSSSAINPVLLVCLLSIALLVAIAGAMVAVNAIVADGYVTDDAYISFRYSRNLADGVGPVWQEGSRVEGYTNFGWVLLIAAASKAGADPVTSSRVLGLAATLATFALIPIAASQLRPTRSIGWWFVVAGVGAALLANTALNIWTFAGLETPLFTMLALAAVTAHWREEKQSQARPMLSALLLLLLALTRPDGVVVWAAIAGWKGLATLRRDLAWRPYLRWVAGFLVPFSIYWVWRWSYYGEFFPNTFYLKSGSGREFYERGVIYVLDFVLVYWAWLVALAGVTVVTEWRARYKPATFGLALLALWSVYVAAGGGDWMPYFRFLVPMVPLFYLLAANGAVDLADVIGRRSPRWRVPALAAVVLVIVFSSARPFDSDRAKDPTGYGFQTDPMPGAVEMDEHREIGRWMRDNIPAEFTIAQIATGIVPYYSQLPTLDMLGVNDAHIAHLDVPVGSGPAGHEKQDGAYVLLSKPEVIWLSIGPEAAPRTTPDDYRPPIDRRLAPVVTGVSHNAYLWVFYRPVAIQLSSGWLNLLVRSDVTTPALTP